MAVLLSPTHSPSPPAPPRGREGAFERGSCTAIEGPRKEQCKPETWNVDEMDRHSGFGCIPRFSPLVTLHMCAYVPSAHVSLSVSTTVTTTITMTTAISNIEAPSTAPSQPVPSSRIDDRRAQTLWPRAPDATPRQRPSGESSKMPCLPRRCGGLCDENRGSRPKRRTTHGLLRLLREKRSAPTRLRWSPRDGCSRTDKHDKAREGPFSGKKNSMFLSCS